MRLFRDPPPKPPPGPREVRLVHGLGCLLAEYRRRSPQAEDFEEASRLLAGLLAEAARRGEGFDPRSLIA